MLTDEIAEYIGSAVDGLAYSDATPDGNVFVDRLPPDPDKAVGVYSTAGPGADSKLPYDPASFQIVMRTRDDDVTWARSMWYKIYSVLHGKRNLTLPGGTYVVFILANQSSPFSIGNDANGRPQFSCDFRTEIINVTDEREQL